MREEEREGDSESERLKDERDNKLFIWTHHHPSTNHNSPHGRVVAQVVASDFFFIFMFTIYE